MTIEDYSLCSKKAQVGSVVLVSKDIKHFYQVGNQFLIELKQFPSYTYLVQGDDYENVLWTMDDHGNPKSRSVFRLASKHFLTKSNKAA